MKQAILFLLLCVLAVASFRVDAQRPYVTSSFPFSCTPAYCYARISRSGRLYVYNSQARALAVQSDDLTTYTVHDLDPFTQFRISPTGIQYGIFGVFDMVPLEGIKKVAFLYATDSPYIRIYDLESRTMETLTIGTRHQSDTSMGYFLHESCGRYIARYIFNTYILTYGDETQLVLCTQRSGESLIQFYDVTSRTITSTIPGKRYFCDGVCRAMWIHMAVGEDGSVYIPSGFEMQIIEQNTGEWVSRSFPHYSGLYPSANCSVVCEFFVGVDANGRYYFSYRNRLEDWRTAQGGFIRINPENERVEIITPEQFGVGFLPWDVTPDGHVLIYVGGNVNAFQVIRFDDYAQMIPLPRPFPFPTPD